MATTTDRRPIDDILIDLADGRISDADVLALGYSRSAWLAYEVQRGAPRAVIVAYWRILDAMPREPETPASVPACEAIDEAWYRGQERRLGLEEE